MTGPARASGTAGVAPKVVRLGFSQDNPGMTRHWLPADATRLFGRCPMSTLVARGAINRSTSIA
jgi:hypothetical protein